MFPFWESVIAPVLDAAGARRVVEVGALRGDTTRRVVEHLGPDGVLHVIDPSPGFDPTPHEEESPGRYVFHRALSLEVLATLEPVDAALVDGDHNWYTVVNELRLLRATSRAAGAALPVLILHDVGWPYGRRDLYYDPATIPAEHRQPHRRAGMRPGRSALREGDGMSQGLENAEHEGGPGNGVMTALEDFLAAHDRPTRTVVLPLYFGLAIVVEDDVLERRPELVEVLDRIEGAEGRRQLLELGEQIRLRAMAQHHTVVGRARDRHDRLAARYLDSVVRELGATGSPGVARLRQSLDAARADGAEGDVVLVLGDDARPAALAAAHRSAHGSGGGRLWVVPAGPPASAEQTHALLARLDLAGDDVVVLPSGASAASLDGLPPVVATVLAAPDLPDASGPLVADLRDRLVPGPGDPVGAGAEPQGRPPRYPKKSE